MLQRVLGGPLGIGLGLIIARILPPRVGYWLADLLTGRVVKTRGAMYRNLRRNLAHVMPHLDAETLDNLAARGMRHAGRTYYDMLRARIRDYVEDRILVEVEKDAWETTLEASRDDRGLVLVGPHISNYDLVSQWMAAHGIEMQALSLTSLGWGGKVVNAIRHHRGIITTPITIASLRSALERLKRGGVVVTGADRPASMDDDLLPFFGEPAPMPTGHIRLALRTNARVQVVSCYQDQEGVYHLVSSPPLEMEEMGNREKTVRHNALRILAIMEERIRAVPDQWLMFVPVWPQDAETEE
ncbi:MAG: lysophospholipid acyltransferase family protein [Anaerolineae bacterium]